MEGKPRLLRRVSGLELFGLGFTGLGFKDLGFRA